MPHSTKAKWDEWYQKNKAKRNQAYNDWYRRNREKMAAKKNEYRLSHPDQCIRNDKRARLARRQAIAQIKLERGCAVCGYKGHPHALQFDHLPGFEKTERVSMMYASKWSEVLNEIAKCQVLCANCHAIITAERRLATAREVRRQEKKSAETQLKLFA